MTFSFRPAALAGASILLLGASLGTAQALPVAPVGTTVHEAGVDQVSYTRRSHHASHRRPNRLRSRTVCGHMPSRC